MSRCWRVWTVAQVALAGGRRGATGGDAHGHPVAVGRAGRATECAGQARNGPR